MPQNFQLPVREISHRNWLCRQKKNVNNASPWGYNLLEPTTNYWQITKTNSQNLTNHFLIQTHLFCFLFYFSLQSININIASFQHLFTWEITWGAALLPLQWKPCNVWCVVSYFSSIVVCAGLRWERTDEDSLHVHDESRFHSLSGPLVWSQLFASAGNHEIKWI